MHLKENNLVMNVTDLVKDARKWKTEDFILSIISPRLRRQPCLSNTGILLVMYTGVTIDSIQKANIHRKHQLSRTFVSRHRRSTDNSSALQTIPVERDNGTLRNVSTCQIKPWHVNFIDIEWDWILYPTNYSVSYCSGFCTGLMDSRITNHAFLRNKYHMATQYRNKSTIPFACCVPSVLNPLMTLFFDRNQTLVVGELPDVIVRKCSCR